MHTDTVVMGQDQKAVSASFSFNSVANFVGGILTLIWMNKFGCKT